jgi:hypothetical protein
MKLGWRASRRHMCDHSMNLFRGENRNYLYLGILSLKYPKYFVVESLADGLNVLEIYHYLFEIFESRENSPSLRSRH